MDDHSPKPISPDVQPWAVFGYPGESEDWLEGNRDGLLVLRRAIDQALEVGECNVDEPHVELMGVRCREAPVSPGHKHSDTSKLAVPGCIALLLLTAVIFTVGLIQVIYFIAGFK